MIYWRIQDLYDANICEQGRVDCEAYMAETGKKATDWLTAVEGLFGGVAGSVWGLGFVKKSSGAAARDALSRFVLQTAKRYTCYMFLPPHVLAKLDALLRGATINLVPMREELRRLSVGEQGSPFIRAVSLMVYVALDDRTALNVRAVRVSEQAMLAATYREGHAVPSKSISGSTTI